MNTGSEVRFGLISVKVGPGLVGVIDQGTADALLGPVVLPTHYLVDYGYVAKGNFSGDLTG